LRYIIYGNIRGDHRVNVSYERYSKLVTSLRGMSCQKRLQAVNVPYLVYREMILYRYTNLFTDFTSLDRHSLLPLATSSVWEDICASWRKGIVTRSVDLISFNLESSVFQMRSAPSVNVISMKGDCFTQDPEDFTGS